MKKLILKGLSITAILGSMQAFALDVTGNLAAHVIVNKPNVAAATTKPIVLMKLQLNSEEKNQILLFHSDHSASQTNKINTAFLPLKVDLGMNGVPVLDQGRHGSCVTFANTAAVDAVMGKGDYVSQLCQLELGSYLENLSYRPSGWNGSLGPYVLNQMFSYGIISKEDQLAKGCAGVTQYPTLEADNEGSPMSLEDYKQMRQNLNEHFFWESYLTPGQRFQWEPREVSLKSELLLLKIKQSLAASGKDNINSRPTFAVIVLPNHCSAGACAKFHQNFDTWAVTDEIKNDPSPMLAGHEMVITGYNDFAVATDNNGKKYLGLLTLRNSWGDDNGDQGNYYMTYDYFKQFVLEAHNISYASSNKTTQ